MLPSSETLEKGGESAERRAGPSPFLAARAAPEHATELLGAAERLKAPIVHALRGKEFIEYDNPYDVGMTGLLGFASGYQAMMNCEALLVLGSDFPYQQFYPKDAKIVQVDVRGEQIGRRTRVDLGMVGTVKETLQGLLPLLEEKSDRHYLDACLQHYVHTRKGLDDLAVGHPWTCSHSSAIRGKDAG